MPKTSAKRQVTKILQPWAEKVRSVCVIIYWAPSHNCGKRLLASSCLSVRMGQLGSHWTDFREIWYLSIFRKSVENIEDKSLQSDKNNRYFTWTFIYIYATISRWIHVIMRNVSDKSYTENQNTHFVFSNFFSPENRAVYEIMWKNIVERGRPQMTI
jgi:hypothetical protein